MCYAEIRGNGEGGRANNFDRSTRYDVGFVLREVVCIGIVSDRSGGSSDILRRQIAGSWRAWENVELASGDVIEGGDVCPKVFS